MRFGALLLTAVAAGAQLRLEQSIPMPGVEGRIDHLSADVKGQRLFVAALGNNSLEVIDLRAGKRARSISGFAEPQGVLYVPAFNRIYVANGETGKLRILDGTSLESVGEVEFGPDADNVRYAPGAKHVWVGYGAGALGELDAATGKRTGTDIRLPAHPESFQLDGARIWVNLPNARQIALIDIPTRAIVRQIAVAGAEANFPMALDATGGRLFTACRKPPRVLVYNTATGQPVAQLPCAGDADDLFFDVSRKRLYVTGGAGEISVFGQVDPDHYQGAGGVRTAAGARTSLFVPSLSRLYVAVPHRGAQRAEIRVYSPE